MSQLVDGGGVVFRVAQKNQVFRVSQKNQVYKVGPGLGGGSSGPPSSAQYVVVALDSGGVLTGARVLTAGTNISITDNGALGTLVINSSGVADPDAQILGWLGL